MGFRGASLCNVMVVEEVPGVGITARGGASRNTMDKSGVGIRGRGSSTTGAADKRGLRNQSSASVQKWSQPNRSW